jgi:MarR family 2-MHQ and catechol resistance regulon transcriptional repressor
MNRPTATKQAPKRAPRPKAADVTSSDAVDAALRLWVVLARAYGAVSRQAELDIARHGLTGMEFGILEVLHHKGPLFLGEIQRKVLVTSGGITYLVDKLEAKGLVERQECPEDRRARYAALTPAGATLIRRIFPAHAKVMARVLSGLDRQEQVEATKLMRKLGLAAAEPLDD